MTTLRDNRDYTSYYLYKIKAADSNSRWLLLRVSTGLEINEKIQSHFAIRYENLVAISQILVAKSLRCIVLSAV